MFLLDADYWVTRIDEFGNAELKNVKTGEKTYARLTVNLNDGKVRVVTAEAYRPAAAARSD